jgi:hypothetical protein
LLLAVPTSASLSLLELTSAPSSAPLARLHQVRLSAGYALARSSLRLTSSPIRPFQVEYALEAVKQGSAAVGLRSNTHAVLLALKVRTPLPPRALRSYPTGADRLSHLCCQQRSTGELASYQQKMFRIDDHVGIAIAGLTHDARVLRSVPDERLRLASRKAPSDAHVALLSSAATLCGSRPCLRR